jgi:hypothetical protein
MVHAASVSDIFPPMSRSPSSNPSPSPRDAASPPTVPGPLPPDRSDETVATVIPYRNVHALIGYYLGIGALIPFLGAVLGPVAVVLGVIGLKRRKANPALHGTAHAWIAIILGSIGALGNLFCVVSGIIAAINAKP